MTIVNEAITLENGHDKFNEYLLKNTLGTTLVPCEEISYSVCKDNLFWKDVICGKDKESPLYFLFIKENRNIINSKFISNNNEQDFSIITSIIENIFIYDPYVDINRETINTNNGFLYKIAVSNENALDKTKYDFVIFSQNTDTLFNIAICLPRKTFLDSNWNTINTKSNFNKILNLRLKKVLGEDIINV